MKLAKSTYVKIGLIVLLCLLLCGWLGGCLRSNRGWSDWGSPWWPLGGVAGCMAFEPLSDVVKDSTVIATDDYDGPENVRAEAWGQGSFEVDAAKVSAIELNWLAGKVNVLVVSDDETNGAIRATETLSGRVPELLWEVSESGTLSIDYLPSHGGLLGCSNSWGAGKELELLIPASLQDHLERFELDAASGDYTIDGASGDALCSQLELDVASGSVAVSDVAVEALDLTLASGRVSYEGTVAQTLSIEQASGEFLLSSTTVPPAAITGSLASGRIVLELPADTALTAQVDKTTGSFRNDFEGAQGGEGAACNLDFDILSGSLELIAS